MGMLSFLSSLFGNEPETAQKVARSTAVADDADEVEGLNFRTAIEAHQRWKARLADYVAGISKEQLDVQVISRDDQCALGKWIHGPGGDHFRDMEGFHHLQDRHAHFHVCAGKILGLAQGGRKDVALEELQTGDYARVSADVVRELANLYLSLRQRR